MGLKVAPAPLHWSQPSVPHSPSSSQTLASAFSSPSSKRCSFASSDAGALFCRHVGKSALFPDHQSPEFLSSGSRRNRNSLSRTIRRALTASLDSFSDEEFSKKIQSLALRFQLGHDEHGVDDYDCDGGSITNDDSVEPCLEKVDEAEHHMKTPFDYVEFREEIIPANIERKANRFDIPLSLRIIKRKKQWQDGLTGARDSACCSVKKAFSSMVFIIRELHSYSLQMREILFYEDLQGILANVQKEMHLSFVWLFQKVFSHTPTLMMYLMILLANYSVHSMSAHAALAAMPPVQVCQVTEQVLLAGDHDDNPSKQKFDSSIIKTLRLSPSPSNGKTASIGGNNGGGGKYRPVGSSMDGEGRFDESNNGGVTSISMDHPSSMTGQASAKEEEALWVSIVDEASRMRAGLSDEALDQETMRKFVAPVDARIETDDQSEYSKTDMFYQTELSQEPENVLLLANYAQFLYLVTRDFDRAEEYFKRATKIEPKDAEALDKYANFLWVVKNDLWAAEETYLEAISAEPDNSYYAANYAHFLWNTGGEDTCFPLSSPDSIDDA